MRALSIVAALSAAMGSAGAASAAVTLYTDQASFQAAFTGSFTLVNLDAGSLGALSPGYNVQSAPADAAFNALGIDFTGLDPIVAAGQDFQIPVPGRDRLIIYGSGAIGGQITLNFLNPVSGVGWRSNTGDGGRVIAYAGLGQSGAEIGTANVASGGFGGLISDMAIQSVTITCDFDYDLYCGAYDIQFGTLARTAPVPEPASWAMLIGGLGLVGAAMRRRRATCRFA